MADDVKYAIVRVAGGGQRMVELFSLLVSHGYSDVSFVSSLAHTVLKTEPVVPTTPVAASQEDASRVTSSSSAAVAATATATAAASVSTSSSPVQPQPTTPTTTPQLQRRLPSAKVEEAPPSTNMDNLLQSLFDRNAEEDGEFAGSHQQPWVLPTGEIPAPPLPQHPPMLMMPMGLMSPSSSLAGGHQFGGPLPQEWDRRMSLKSLNYAGLDGMGRKMPFTERMKGWQRKMLNEAIVNGIPSGAELAALCERCQVTETQAIRFFRKRRYGQAGLGGGFDYQMEDDGDGRGGESPEVVTAIEFNDPKTEEDME